MITCNGCGVVLDFENESSIGFAHAKNKDGLCQRCYQLKNFNKAPTLGFDSDAYDKIFLEVIKEKSLIIWLIDIFDFSASFYQFISENLKDVEVLIVANKRDIIPKSVKDEKIIEFINQETKHLKNVIGVELISATKNYNLDQILDYVDETHNKTAYIIGTTNVGKSTLINHLVRSIEPESADKVTTSYYAGTTLGKIKIEIDGLTLYDTPGVINEEQFIHYLDKESIDIIFPKKELRPTTFQLEAEQTLFITGLARVDFIKGSCNSFTVYASNRIEVHRTALKNSDEIFANHFGDDLLQVPNENEISRFTEFKTEKLVFTNSSDIVINGLCFIAVKNVTRPVYLEVTVPVFCTVSSRKNLI